jgi:hypothetical protein
MGSDCLPTIPDACKSVFRGDFPLFYVSELLDRVNKEYWKAYSHTHDKNRQGNHSAERRREIGESDCRRRGSHFAAPTSKGLAGSPFAEVGATVIPRRADDRFFASRKRR